MTKASIELDADAIDPSLKDDANNDAPAKLPSGLSSSSCTVCGEVLRSDDQDYCRPCAATLDSVRSLQSSTKVTKTMQLLQQFRNEAKGVDKDGNKKPPKKVIIFSQVSSDHLYLQARSG